jgi:hypothetical protein
LSPGGRRTVWRGFAARAVGALSMRSPTPMARLRKKGRWLDHGQAMIEGGSLLKTAELYGVHPSTAFRWRHRFLGSPAADKPRTLSGIVEADETVILKSFKGRRSDLPRKARKARRLGPASGPLSREHRHSRGARPLGRGGRAIAAFARKAKIPLCNCRATRARAQNDGHGAINRRQAGSVVRAQSSKYG